MTNIALSVKEYLDRNFIITTCLLKNIMSLRALSRYLCKTLDLDEKNLNAVMSAIRRYKKENKLKEETHTKKIFSDVIIKTKDNLVDIYVAKNKEVQEKLNEFNKFIDVEKGDVLRVIQAEEGIMVMIDKKNLVNFNKLFSSKEIISVRENLAEVIFKVTVEGPRTPGIVSIISSSLYASGINLVEIMSSSPELIFLVNEEDLIKTINTISNLKKLY